MSKKKIVVNIQQGKVLINFYIKNNLVYREYFSSFNNEVKVSVLSLIKKYSIKYCKIVIEDYINESYQHEKLPKVNRRALNGIIENKLNLHENESCIKSSIIVPSSSSEYNEVIFIKNNISKESEVWFDFFQSINVIIESFHFSYIELQFINKAINKYIAEDLKTDKADYNILIVNTKLNGLQQVVFYKEVIFFIRKIDIIDGSNIDIISGSIEQEVSGTINFLNRQPNTKINVISMLPGLLGQNFSKLNINANLLYNLSLQDLKDNLKLKINYDSEDTYLDTVIASNVYLNKSQKKLKYKDYCKKYSIYKKIFWCNVLLLNANTIVMIFLLFTGLDTINNRSSLQHKKVDENKQLALLDKIKSEFKFNNNVITDQDIAKAKNAATLYSKLQNFSNIADFRLKLDKLFQIMKGNQSYHSMDNFKFFINDKEIKQNISNSDTKENNKTKLELRFYLIANQGLNLSQLKDRYYSFINEFEKIFNNSNVKYLEFESLISGVNNNDNKPTKLLYNINIESK